MKRKAFLFFSVLMVLFQGMAQETRMVPTQNLNISDGLAHNGVTSILEDSKGYIWFGTYDGLNKYDGYELKTYKNTLDKDILVSNRVRSLVEDTKGSVWIGTDEGVTIYNTEKETFKTIYSNKQQDNSLSGPVARKILVDKENNLILCISEDHGILLFNENYEFQGKYVFSGRADENSIEFYSGFKLTRNTYLMSTSGGLVLFDIDTGNFSKILPRKIRYSKSGVKINSNTFLITDLYGVKVIEIDIINDQPKFSLKQSHFLDEQFVESSVDSQGNVWLSSLNHGLVKIDKSQDLKADTLTSVSAYRSETGLLRGSKIKEVTNNYCWFATFNEGLFRFEINNNPFKKCATQVSSKYGQLTNHVNHITKYDEHRVLLTTGVGGLSMFNTHTQSFEKLPFNVSNDKIKSIVAVYKLSNGDIWFKLNRKGGLYRFRKSTGKTENVFAKNLQPFNRIGPRSFSEDKDGNLWIGSFGGLYKVSFEKNGDINEIASLNDHSYFKYSKLTLVRFVYYDKEKDFLWLGADSDGLFRVKLDSGQLITELKIDQFLRDKKDKKSISSNFVTSVLRLPNQQLWIGTEGGGICEVVEKQDKLEFNSYSEKQGLSNNAVKSIQYDDKGNLWVSTNIGLNKFDIEEKRFRSYGIEDGLPFEDFWFASKKLPNGHLLFSGLDGLCYFKPEELPNKEPLPRLEFGEFKIFNKQIFPGDTLNDRVLYNSQLTDNAELTLFHNENVFSIDLNSLHFSNPDSHYLKYKLEPTNQDWIEVPSDERTVYYNGLQSGEYTLKVKASNSLNEWTDTKHLTIKILPPFWKTIWAYILYVVLVLGFATLVFYFFLHVQKLNHNLQIEQLEKDKVKEVNSAKLRFFSNISHEIKTPLTLISGPVELLSELFKGNANIREKLQIVKRQAKKISQLVDQVHDFQRAEANLLKMRYSTFCFNDFIDEITEDFGFIAEQEEKTLDIVAPSDPVFVTADRDKLEKILNNLLSNAFKYTLANDFIKVEYRILKENIIIAVSDSGRGIDSDDLSHVFERFYQSQKKHGEYIGGSGIGLAFTKRLVELHFGSVKAESELNIGTTVTITLPVVVEKTEEEILEREARILELEKKQEAEYVHNNSMVEKVNPKSLKVEGDFSESVIFFAEDNVEMRSFVYNILSHFFTVKVFPNGQKLVDEVQHEWPDLIISDLLMPEMNGLEVCKNIKANIKTSHIPILLLTACTTIDHQIQGIKDGADAYIKKPFNIQYLLTSIESLLRSRKQLRERFQIDFPLTLENDGSKSKDNEFIEKLYELMAENLDNQDLDINTFAKELYLNRTHFYQKVKALTNHTPFELLKLYRLKKAADFLVQKSLSVNEVYVMTGFKSRTHFSKLFKEKYEVTPGKYAAEMKKKYES